MNVCEPGIQPKKTTEKLTPWEGKFKSIVVKATKSKLNNYCDVVEEVGAMQPPCYADAQNIYRGL